MKTLLALTVLTLLCFLKHSSAMPAGIRMTIVSEECCETVSNTKYIPFKRVTNVTTSDCKLKAIIVATEANNKFCLDPEWKHTQKHVEEFQKRSEQSGMLNV